MKSEEKNTMSQTDKLSFCWNYFELHSKQRMQMVNFYITIEAAIIGAFILLIQLETRITWAECILSAWIVLISVTFWGLDNRTRNLIHNCERIIKKIETVTQDKLPIFTSSDALCGTTYTFWFRSQYFIIGTFGIVSFILVIFGVI